MSIIDLPMSRFKVPYWGNPAIDVKRCKEQSEIVQAVGLKPAKWKKLR
jgi:hypothetical protein